ncbi:tRNA (adenosine(37)-N6)-dimethylallyltransferase MiaA [Ancylobacter mangrovi]|uniref:tRNA (adenosine(37)-N6)-dimethylallyltransferase MiaA n=1 Tax=Ancylobacter mangrovi TaxID=2972472 RepID=UPI002161D4E6|nr:tRNA (adenosine(37)-N6)-dimethylallyltransferase MiaA [Ancylobacter mangrovi]MCS0503836.1 tRNA (adenosine(37)-N6)-dimethylallyltransferase MiaA [Ancylobacter mangrovi]
MSAAAIRPRAVLIAGPTASGKSALALALAERSGGVVINADSMQVYRDLRIISARPTREEEARAPHRLYGHVDGAQDYSVAHWLEDARREIAAAWEAGRLPILIGGTGLYFKALTQGLSPMPPVPPEIRARVRGLGEDAGRLHARLAALDPASAERLRPSDTQRLMRALEVFEATGRPLVEWQKERGAAPPLREEETARLFLATDRTALRERIAGRFHAMMAAGALEEVAALDARRLPEDRTILKAHGVPWLRRHLAGEIGLEEAIAGGILDTRRYAKRQDTWFRHQLQGWTTLPAELAGPWLEQQLV